MGAWRTIGGPECELQADLVGARLQHRKQVALECPVLGVVVEDPLRLLETRVALVLPQVDWFRKRASACVSESDSQSVHHEQTPDHPTPPPHTHTQLILTCLVELADDGLPAASEHGMLVRELRHFRVVLRAERVGKGGGEMG